MGCTGSTDKHRALHLVLEVFDEVDELGTGFVLKDDLLAQFSPHIATDPELCRQIAAQIGAMSDLLLDRDDVKQLLMESLQIQDLGIQSSSRAQHDFYGSSGRVLDAAEVAQRPLLSREFEYAHKDKACSYRDERLCVTDEEVDRVNEALHAGQARDIDAELESLGSSDRPIKLIIDTDIGTDCDDVLALMIALNIPATDVEILGITCVYHPTLLRKRVAECILHAAGGKYHHIPVLAGPSRVCGTHRDFFHQGNEGKGLGLSAEEEEQLWEEHRGDEAVEFIYETVKTNPGEVVIAVIGTGTNLGLCANRHPDFEDLVAHIVFMGGGSVVTDRVWAESWARDYAAPFELPDSETTALSWASSCDQPSKPIHLFPNINVSNDTLGTCMMLRCKCPISLIPHYITKEHWLQGRPIETLLKLGTESPGAKDDNGSGAGQMEASCVAGKLVVEWLKTRRGQRGQCLHDPLTIYEAVYPGLNPNPDTFTPGYSSLRYVRGTLICHEWAGYITFAPNPAGLHRLAIGCIDPDRWTDEWAGPTLITGVPTSECTDWFPGFHSYSASAQSAGLGW